LKMTTNPSDESITPDLSEMTADELRELCKNLMKQLEEEKKKNAKALCGSDKLLIHQESQEGNIEETLKKHPNLERELDVKWEGQPDFRVLCELLKRNAIPCKSLNLADCKIGVEEAKMLTDALMTNTTMQTLYLMNNNIGDLGAKMIVEALQTNKSLATLYLWYNHISEHMGESLKEAWGTRKGTLYFNTQ